MLGWTVLGLLIGGLALIVIGMRIVNGPGVADQRLGGAIPVVLGGVMIAMALLVVLIAGIIRLF